MGVVVEGVELMPRRGLEPTNTRSRMQCLRHSAHTASCAYRSHLVYNWIFRWWLLLLRAPTPSEVFLKRQQNNSNSVRVTAYKYNKNMLCITDGQSQGSVAPFITDVFTAIGGSRGDFFNFFFFIKLHHRLKRRKKVVVFFVLFFKFNVAFFCKMRKVG